MGTNLYSVRISRHLPWSRVLYNFWSSRHTLYKTASLMAVICCISLTFRVAVPVPWTSQNPCRTSWNVIAAVKRWFRRLVTVFQKYLYKANPPEVSTTALEYQDNCLPSGFVGNCSMTEISLHYGYYLLTVGGIIRFVPHYLSQTTRKVFCPYSWWSTRAVQANPAHLRGVLLVFRDRFIDGQWIHSHRDCLDQRWVIPVKLQSYVGALGPMGLYGPIATL